jgi:hypothetical protein
MIAHTVVSERLTLIQASDRLPGWYRLPGRLATIPYRGHWLPEKGLSRFR